MKSESPVQSGKDQLRTAVWENLTEKKQAAFPFPIKGRIPNFKGASAAAAHLFDTPLWQQARVIKANPDAPQRAIRKRAIEEGKLLYMAVPRLREERCFIRLDVTPDQAARAATIKGAGELGVPVHPSEMEPVDLVIAGSVAVNTRGERIGKGGGYCDLELALGFHYGLLNENTVFVSTVHSEQVFDHPLPQEPHDTTLDLLFTPEGMLKCTPQRPRPQAIFWETLPEEKKAAIPILQQLSKDTTI